MASEKKNIHSLEELKESFEKAKHNAKKYYATSIAISLIPVPDDFSIIKYSALSLSLLKAITEDTKVIKHYIKLKSNYINSMEYSGVYNSYYEVLNHLVTMSEELDWDNEVKLFAGYSYLLKNGYLSNNHEFYYSYDDSDILANLHGANICGTNVIVGYGNCKHINSFLTDLLRLKEFQTHNIIMNLYDLPERLNDDSLQRLNDDSLQRLNDKMDDYDKIQKNKIFYSLIRYLYLISKGNPNHLVTLFSSDDYSYILDATNDTFFWVDDNKKVYLDDYFYSISTAKRFNPKSISLSKLLKTTPVEEKERILKDYYQIYNSCQECIDVFEKFYNDNRELYQEISQKKKILICNDRKYSQTLTK